MSFEKVVSNKKHIKGIKSAITHYGSQAKLARFLGISPANVQAWLCGMRVIPITHAEAIHKDGLFPPVHFLELRPDLARLEKYFK